MKKPEMLYEGKGKKVYTTDNIAGDEVRAPMNCRPGAQGICATDVNNLETMPEQRLLDLGFIDVTAAPFSADPSGKDDSTKAIQEAVFFARHHRLAAYFPVGNYSVSDTITCWGGRTDERFDDHRYLPFSECWPAVLVGERRGDKRPRVILSPSSPGFDKPETVKPVFHFDSRFKNRIAPKAPLPPGTGCNAYHQTFYGINVEISDENPGAVAITFGEAEGSSIQDCEFDAGSGYAGIYGAPGNGSGLFNLVFKGGRFGLAATDSEMGVVTAAGCRFEGQREAAVIFSQRGPLCLVGCHLVMQPNVPALITRQTQLASRINGAMLIDCRIEYPYETTYFKLLTTTFATIRAETPIYVRNSYIRHADALVESVVPGQGYFGRLSKNWTYVEEFAYDCQSSANTVPHPIYVDKERHVKQFVRITYDAMPPDDLCKRHILWDHVSFPAWNSPGVVNVREAPYFAVGNGENDDTEALQRALNENEAIFLPKGAYKITAPLRLGSRNKIIGVNAAYSMIAPSGELFSNVEAPCPAIMTADTSDAETQLAFFSVFMPREDATGAYVIDWTCGGTSCLRSVFSMSGYCQNDILPLQHGLRPWHNWHWTDELLSISMKEGPVVMYRGESQKRDSWKGSERYEDCIPNWPYYIVRGHGGGAFYPFMEEGSRTHGPGHRRILVDGIKGPFAIYNANLQHGQGITQMEIRNSSGVSLYGTKNENNSRVIWIRNSSNIAVYGIGSTAIPLKDAIFLVENSQRITLAGLFSESWEVFWNLPEHREIPILRVVFPHGGEYLSAVHDRPTLFRF